MRHFLLFTFMLLMGTTLFAQTRQLTGLIKDAKSGEGLPSVSIRVKGGNASAVTNSTGAFSISVPATAFVLDITSVGYAAKSVSVEPNENNVMISLDPSSEELGEIVVTALGISKEAKKLGYAVTTVSGNQLNKARETNVALSLSGQVAGLNVRSTNGGPGGSARILLRGMSSLTAGSPLFVINGVPMDNTQKGSAGEWGGADNGDGIGNLNPDDIESMTVLKGQAASALYGARASNGVIQIVTKTGKKGTVSIDYNLNYMVDQAIDFTDFQYTYGQGIYGAKPTTAAEAQTYARMSWGARLDGSQVIQFDGNSYAYSAVKDNIKNFYRAGPSLTNTISVSGGTDRGTYRISMSNLDNKSIIPNSGISRKTINLSLDQKVTDKLTVTIAANYLDQKDNNRPNLSDGPLNANNGQFLATNIDQKILAPGFVSGSGAEVVFSDDIYVTNPYFVINQFVNDIDRKRFITSMSVKYDITPWMYALARAGYDLLNDRYFSVTPWGTAYSQDLRGGLNNLSRGESSILNLDGILGASKNITKDLNFSALAGINLQRNKFESVGVNGGPFIAPYQYSFNNVVNFGRSYGYSRKESQSAFYSVDFTYKNFITLSTTGRYDEFSTVYNSAIPKGDRGIFTPSVSMGLIFSELIDIPKLSYGKFRASFAQTSGEPGDPYQTAVTYSIGNTLNGVSTASFGSTLPNAFLKPFTVTEFEVGLEAKMFNNRLGLDIAYFNKKTKDEILSGSLSAATGYSANSVATGSVQNKGLELLITGTPVKGKDFQWNTSFNFTTLNNKVLETNVAGNNLGQGSYRPLNANTVFIKGMAGPQIVAFDYARDAKGEMIVDAAGLPVRGALTPFGSVLPKIYGGWKNELIYKDFSLDFLFDYNFGNKVLSASTFYAIRRGLHQMTLEGRETGVTKGVTAGGAVNTVTARAQDYYMALAQNVSAVNVLNGDFIKLRQLTITYSLPSKMLENVPVFKGASISLVGRNLLVLMKKTDNMDPEAGFSSTVRYAGIEGTSLPSTRTMGVNLNLKFK